MSRNTSRIRLPGAVVVLTGASSGIGREAALLFHRYGARLVLASRNRAALETLAAEMYGGSADILVAPTDVSRDDQVRAMVSAALDRFGRIDLLIANAGVGLYSDVADLPLDALRKAFEVNFFGVVRCIQAVLPSMLERRRGLIQIVSSVIGRRAMPGYGGYCATKFALYGLAESLQVELRGSGVSVQTVYPTLTETPFADNSLIANPAGPPARIRAMPAPEAARHLLRAARRGSRDHVVSWGGKAVVFLNGISPRLVDAIVARALPARPDKDADALPDRR